MARLRRMITYAQEQDIVLLHENEKDIYGDTVDRCADLMKELYSVFREIAPDNSPKKLKDEMRRQNLFETNLPNGRTQKQVGATLQDMIGIVNNKIFEIKLPEEVLDKMMEEKSYWDEVLDDSFDEFFVNEFDEWEEI